MWEICENILHHVKGDVLVIFDCCDAGSLTKLRSTGRAFEYLGACGANKYTHPPGKNSFTTALTWALKDLSSAPPFTTAGLVSKIKEYEGFPEGQKPVLFPRWDFMPEHIWISNRRAFQTPTLSRQRSSSAPEFRDENCDYVDVRVTFSRPLSGEDGKAVAEMMAPLVRNRKLPVNARHVSFLKKGMCKPTDDYSARWIRARNHVLAFRTFQSLIDRSGTMPIRKRKRPPLDTEREDHSRVKYSKPSFIPDIDLAGQLPTSSSSEDPDSGSEVTLAGRVDATTSIIPKILDSLCETESDSTDRINILLEELEKLKQDALDQPGVSSVLLSRIRAVLAEEIR